MTEEQRAIRDAADADAAAEWDRLNPIAPAWREFQAALLRTWPFRMAERLLDWLAAKLGDGNDD